MPCFFYSVLLVVMLGGPQLTARCVLHITDPLALRSGCRDSQSPRQGTQGTLWQALHETRKRRYQYHRGPVQSLNRSLHCLTVPHCTVTTAPFPSQQARRCRCRILAAILVGAPHRKTKSKTVVVLWMCLCRARGLLCQGTFGHHHALLGTALVITLMGLKEYHCMWR